MGWLGRDQRRSHGPDLRARHQRHTLRDDLRTDERFRSPHEGVSYGRERTDTYWAWLVVGLIAPFALAALIKGLVW